MCRAIPSSCSLVLPTLMAYWPLILESGDVRHLADAPEASYSVCWLLEHYFFTLPADSVGDRVRRFA